MKQKFGEKAHVPLSPFDLQRVISLPMLLAVRLVFGQLISCPETLTFLSFPLALWKLAITFFFLCSFEVLIFSQPLVSFTTQEAFLSRTQKLCLQNKIILKDSVSNGQSLRESRVLKCHLANRWPNQPDLLSHKTLMFPSYQIPKLLKTLFYPVYIWGLLVHRGWKIDGSIKNR